MEPCFLSVTEASERIAARSLTATAYLESVLGRIAAVDGRVRAYITPMFEEARLAAAQADAEIAAGRRRGPLHGIPFAVKDNYHVAGVRTSGGSRLMLDHVADQTSTIVARLQAAGAILLGKLNTWEYGTGNGGVYFDLPFDVARNPWDLDRFTGGSSTGSGAAVAAGLAPFALGSDTGGSIRLPAAACGLMGLKPTYGRTSRAGCLPNCWSLDVTGALCWTVADSALVLNTIAGFDASDPASADRPVPDYRAGLRDGVRHMVIGLVTGMEEEPISPDILAGLEAARAALEAAGARIIDIALPEPLARYRQPAGLINQSESHSIHEADYRDRPELMGQALWEKMTSGSLVRAADYIAAQRMRRHLAEGTERLFSTCDLLLMPGAFRVAPRFDDAAGTMAFTRESAMNIASMTGHPAMSVVSGFDAAGMPLNIQLMGPYFEEARVLRAALVLEAALADRDRRPALMGGEGPAGTPVPADREARRTAIAAAVRAAGEALPRLPAKDDEPANCFRP
ncbi:amidase [Rhodovarius crocodyli]|uniref:Amidase n=1 Tax=Rhodovarius crocodyli TaxID=1979269 RepID=A0A437MFC4_9PROT|nr:amidase [Rhodovarius crocodyli]RVT96332.1 amidase [Rhodovarius crocodyli]